MNNRELWQNRRSIRKVKDLGIPQFLIDKKIPVYDAVSFASKPDRVVDLNSFFPEKPNRRESRWAYMIGHKTRLLEGASQAQILTNSIAHSKLPKEYQNAFNSMSLNEDETKWLQNRLEIIKLDSKQFKLPHRVDPQRPWHRFPREYGPGIGRRTFELMSALNDFVRLNSTRDRAVYKPLVHELSCQYIGMPKKNPDGSLGVNPYVYQGYASSAVTVPIPLSVLTSSSSSDVSGPTGSLPSMYPALPEMDLCKKFDYEPKTFCPLSPCPFTKDGVQKSSVSLHTLFITHPWENDDWKPSEKLGRAIMQSFTFAAAYTVGRLGEVVSTEGSCLPVADRLRLQTVYHDLDTVGFIVYHLNTLAQGSSYEPNGAIRNELYHECAPLRENDELNPRVLKWLKVFYEA
ncbi:uncharacterized protein LOC111253724 isoform X2 [Varroa destructor]|uniref:Uncharacterized protein n=1 Tax=Varroa destructor TaxID=109461 RepID=A0A7M7KQG3_VARDE|nr:uncharacterized protein LOC111253724 isoform X2 [Varroa destructor]XP_022669291.1 uncharacterized protein LOC111253724 isoform X2 [Varroa destructor]